MNGIEYMQRVCPTTSRGKDPNREDVADAFEDGIAEGIKMASNGYEKVDGIIGDVFNGIIDNIEFPIDADFKTGDKVVLLIKKLN